jgi:hypothetical protein
MGLEQKPKSRLAADVLPAPLHRALTHVFSSGLSGCMLVGGTALAGYYAAHRRSDDLDLFTEDDLSQKAAVLAVKSLRDIGATLGDERTTAHFYHATCHLDGHDFTAQVVLDSNLFEIGSGAMADDGVFVADLKTLLKMKAATLVSRGSEKDLYDLRWLFDQESELDLATLIALGTEVDGGMNAEALLTNLVGTQLRESACDFSLTQGSVDVYAVVTQLQKSLVRGIESFLRGRPAPSIAALVRKLR